MVAGAGLQTDAFCYPTNSVKVMKVIPACICNIKLGKHGRVTTFFVISLR